MVNCVCTQVKWVLEFGTWNHFVLPRNSVGQSQPAPDNPVGDKVVQREHDKKLGVN